MTSNDLTQLMYCFIMLSVLLLIGTYGNGTVSVSGKLDDELEFPAGYFDRAGRSQCTAWNEVQIQKRETADRKFFRQQYENVPDPADRKYRTDSCQSADQCSVQRKIRTL